MSQKTVYGIEGITNLINNRRFLLVRDSAYDYLPFKSLFDMFPHTIFSSFTPNPLYEQVCEGVKLFNESGCDMIIAVGGGSAIDVAKCIKLFCKMNADMNYLEQERQDTGIQLIAVPTTAGTGSESTRHAVIYYEGKKQSISHPSIIPDVAVLEPSALKTLPLYQKKCTMLDALCQAIESWWSVGSTAESIEYSKKAIKLIVANQKEYITENTDEAASKIMEAANYAGRAINITATTAAHAMSYKLTSMYKLPHGHAVALCMTHVWEYIISHPDDCIDSRGEYYLKQTLSDISKLISLEQFKTIINDLEMQYPFSESKQKDIDILTESVNPVRLKNNPVALRNDVIKGMYERIVKE